MAPKRLNILKWDGLIKNAFQVKKKKKGYDWSEQLYVFDCIIYWRANGWIAEKQVGRERERKRKEGEEGQW